MEKIIRYSKLIGPYENSRSSIENNNNENLENFNPGLK